MVVRGLGDPVVVVSPPLSTDSRVRLARYFCQTGLALVSTHAQSRSSVSR